MRQHLWIWATTPVILRNMLPRENFRPGDRVLYSVPGNIRHPLQAEILIELSVLKCKSARNVN